MKERINMKSCKNKNQGISLINRKECKVFNIAFRIKKSLKIYKIKKFQ